MVNQQEVGYLRFLKGGKLGRPLADNGDPLPFGLFNYPYELGGGAKGAILSQPQTRTPCFGMAK
jgi:hypothetical protein